MNTYIVTFDVKDNERLSKLKGVLKESRYYCPIHENAWAVRVERTASDLRNELMEHAAPEDRLFVIRSGVEAAWKNSYGKDHSNWLKKNL